MSIRAATTRDLPVLRDIERDAGRLFAGIGMDAVADDEPLSIDELDTYRRADRLWVAVDVSQGGEDDEPVGYLAAEVVDGNAHVEQVSVRPSSARRGIGRALVEHVAGWAEADGLPAITLTTFVDVPWNAPYYRRLGFRELADDEVTPGLRAKRAEEAAHGLDRWPRVSMRRERSCDGRVRGQRARLTTGDRGDSIWTYALT